MHIENTYQKEGKKIHTSTIDFVAATCRFCPIKFSFSLIYVG
jgi:hypothetical protein